VGKKTNRRNYKMNYSITLNEEGNIASSNLGTVRLVAFQVNRDTNGNPMYRIHVTGITYDLPKLFLPKYTSKKGGFYSMQSHQGLVKMFETFIERHGEELQALGTLTE
jgi:hypothetical protein